jgi:2-phospho-L-lactate/phosphoenolpyruvate guanylyltransferase
LLHASPDSRAANVWGLVPVKGFARAKSRLSDVLGTVERERLARQLFEHVVGVLSSHRHLAGVAIVTDDREVARLASARAALVIEEQAPPATRDLAQVVDQGLDALEQHGARAALVVMGDLPGLKEADVDLLLSALREFDVIVVSDERGTHTNALGLSLGDRRPTHFGAPDSFRRHCESALSAGLSLGTPSSPGLAFDLDLPEDWAKAQSESRLKRWRASCASSA